MGTPLMLAASGCCAWYYAVDFGVPGMTVIYEAAGLSGLDASWASSIPHDTIVTFLDLVEARGVYAMVLSQTTQAGEFTPSQGSTAPEQLQAVASVEGAAGRVITALSFAGAQVSWVSYGWSLDPSGVYEARGVATSFDDLAADAAALAAEGYVITAAGAGDGAGGVFLLVGTRAPGGTASRPLAIAHDNISEIAGYAMVCAAVGPGTAFVGIGEN